MISMTLAEVAAAVGGQVVGDPEVVVTAAAAVDSRSVPEGGLFVAVAGEHVDGHDYAPAALRSGAAAVLGSRATAAATVVVDDVVLALGRLASYVVGQLPSTTVLAITGSQGKTGTKDYLAQILGASGPTVATAGNNNNEIGVPLTMLRATPETRYLVLEMGARGIGHIAYLCDLARPSIAAVLNVGTAHVGEFGSREAIAVAKGEIVEGLPADGVGVLNGDDPFTREMGARTDARVITFGEEVDNDLHFVDTLVDDLGRATTTYLWEGVERRVSLTQPGFHQVLNAAAAAAMALGAGLAFDDVMDALGSAVSMSRWRMELHESAEGVVILNDSYNANPASMRAALTTLQAIGVERGARTIAVLGEMRELGAETEEAHLAIGAFAAARGIDTVLAIGEVARHLLDGVIQHTESSTTGVYAADRAAALAWLRENIAPGDVLVVKASRGAELDKVAEVLVEENP
ncbi:UDP-N-acetylmuramoyl-tripeptide--D-alanyl-D-alanine ligase [Nocardioides sp.]|uniref:UDP-N-acetylmuramoyl-tripeptide--D-alanyl-D- alanine ligase n=1 Tax=Nocardioides sp. TaxID=35761 RepID=UPI003D117571